MSNLLRHMLAFLPFMQVVFSMQMHKRLVCYYNYRSSGFVQMRLSELKSALPSCTHLVYDSADLSSKKYKISNNGMASDYRRITKLKKEYPHIKVYLSLGGDRDPVTESGNKYIQFLESASDSYENFIESSIELIQANDFDGLDLAFQLPRNKPRKVHSAVGSYLKAIKKRVKGDFIVDPDSEIHKQQFSQFAEQIHRKYSAANLTLSLTVLPNVNSTWYFDIPKIQDKFEYINLFAFDFVTPLRNPYEADYTAPIYFQEAQNRLPYNNVDYQVQYWIDNGCPAHKLNLGIATHGRAWKTSKDAALNSTPIVPARGPASVGMVDSVSSLVAWPEVCLLKTEYEWKDFTMVYFNIRHAQSDAKYGFYEFLLRDKNYEYGVWIGYDDPEFAAIKTEYAKQKGLGGMALYDLSYDDFKGICKNEKYPILNSIKRHLEQ